MAFFLRKPPVSVVVERWAQDARDTAQQHTKDAEKYEARAALATAQALHSRKLAQMYENLALGYVIEGAKIADPCMGGE